MQVFNIAAAINWSWCGTHDVVANQTNIAQQNHMYTAEHAIFAIPKPDFNIFVRDAMSATRAGPATTETKVSQTLWERGEILRI